MNETPAQKLVEAVNNIEPNILKKALNLITRTPSDWSGIVAEKIEEKKAQLNQYANEVINAVNFKGDKTKFKNDINRDFQQELNRITAQVESKKLTSLDSIVQDILDGFEKSEEVINQEKKYWEDFAKNNPINVIKNTQIIVKIDIIWAKKIIEQIIEKDPMYAFDSPLLLAEIDQVWAKSILEKATQKAPMFVLYIPNLLAKIDQNWAKNLLEKAAFKDVNNAFYAKELFEFDKNWAENLLKKLAQNPVNLAQHAKVLAEIDYAWTKFSLEDMVYMHSYVLLNNAEQLGKINKEWAKYLLEQAIKKEPYKILENAQQLVSVDIDWAKDILKTTVNNNPEDALKNIKYLVNIDINWLKSFLDKNSLENIANKKPEITLINATQLAKIDTKWAKKILKVAAEKDPWSVLEQAEQLAKIDKKWAKPILKLAAEREPWKTLIRAIELASIDKEWAKLILENILSKKPRRILFNAQQLIAIDEDWAKPIIEDAANKQPDFTLYEIHKLIGLDIVWLKPILKKVVEKKPAIGLQVADTLAKIDKKWAKPILKKATYNRPKATLKNIKHLVNIDINWLKSFLDKNSLENIANKESEIIFKNIEYLLIIDKEWTKRLVNKVDTDFWYILEKVEQLAEIDKEWAKPILKLAAEKDPERALEKAEQLAKVDKKWAKPILKFAAEKDPWSVLKQAEQLAKIDKKWAKPILKLAAEKCPLDALYKKNHLIKIDKKWAEPIIKLAQRKINMITTARTINELHEETDSQIRYAAIKDFNTKDLYDLVVYARAEIFTSSYNEVMDKFLKQLLEEPSDFYQFSQKNKFKNIGIFLEAAAAYNRTDELLDTIKNPQQKIQLLNIFISNIIKKKDLKDTVALAEITMDIKNKEVFQFLENKIIEIFNKTEDETVKNMFGLLVSNLIQERSQDLTKKKFFATFDKEKYKLPILNKIPSSELFDSAGRNIQQYFFYNDKDGKTSFNNFLAKYKNDSKWKFEDKNSFVVIKTQNPHTSKQILIYANKPEFDGYEDEKKDGIKDIKNNMENFDPPLESIVSVHRGHSYHAWKTIENLSPVSKMVFLGSCGGYQNFDGVLDKSPETHIIATKGEGTKFINDPIFKLINNEILAGKNIVWKDIWKKAAKEKSNHPKYAKLKDDPRFKYYVRPDKNFGVMFIKKFKELEKAS